VIETSAAADPVLALVSDAMEDPRRLYYLWEQQQWEAGKVDLTSDAAEWKDVDPQLRRAVSDTVAWRRLRAEFATTALVVFVDVAPQEEQQVFLTTHLVDEARHLVFFDRVLTEVLEVHGEAIGDRRGLVDDESLRRLLTDGLPRFVRELRAGGPDQRALVTAVTAFHLVTLGALGLTTQRALDGYLSENNILPGIRRGLELEARDAERHVAFAVILLAHIVGSERILARTAAEAVASTFPLVRSALASAASLAPTVYGSYDLAGSAESAVDGWLEAAGLELPVRS
jgi:ribonucleoside-diphosphate reductase beta chain